MLGAESKGDKTDTEEGSEMEVIFNRAATQRLGFGVAGQQAGAIKTIDLLR